MDFLLALQGFRMEGGEWLAVAMNLLSRSVQYVLILVPVFFFWNVSREEGYWYMLNLGLADFTNNFVKLSACIYRPWIRDVRVTPWEGAVGDATGYSFPSGHTAIAAAVLGGVGIRQMKKRKWLSALMFTLVLIIAFSRTYLGVHTLQDVLTGILETCLIIVFNSWLIRQLRGNERKQDLWTYIGFAVVLLSLLYFQLKLYPMDEADGVLLADPQSMMKDAYMSAGTLLGFLTGSLWERKKIHYDPSGTVRERILRSAIGLIPLLLIYAVLRKPAVALLGVKAGNLTAMFLMTFFVTGIYPYCIMEVKQKLQSRFG